MRPKGRLKSDIVHTVLFLLVCFIAFIRADLPNFEERDVYVRVSVAGDILVEENRTTMKVRVEDSEIEDIKGRKAFLTVYGYVPGQIRTLSLIGDIRAVDNRIFIYSSSKDVEFLPPEKSVRYFLMERYREVSRDKGIVSLGLAFLFGEPRELLPSHIRKDFLETGLVHLLVVSGLHVGMVALILSFLLPRFYGLKLAVLGVVIYSLFIVPSEPPILRATLMAVILLLSYLFFVRINSFAVLLFSGSVILAFYPYYVLSYSFWLSFIATSYIILMLRDLKGSNKTKTLLASFSAFSGIAPIVGSFSAISPVSVILSPFLAPLVLLYSALGVFSLLTLMSFPPLVDLFNLTGHLFTGAVSLFAELSIYLYPHLSPLEGFLLSITGLLFLYILRGLYRLIPLIFMNLYMLFKIP